MKGADMWDTVVRYETSLLLHVGCGLEPDASSALPVHGTSGMEDMGVSGRELNVVALREVWREREKWTDGRMELQCRG